MMKVTFIFSRASEVAWPQILEVSVVPVEMNFCVVAFCDTCDSVVLYVQLYIDGDFAVIVSLKFIIVVRKLLSQYKGKQRQSFYPFSIDIHSYIEYVFPWFALSYV